MLYVILVHSAFVRHPANSLPMDKGMGQGDGQRRRQRGMAKGKSGRVPSAAQGCNGAAVDKAVLYGVAQEGNPVLYSPSYAVPSPPSTVPFSHSVLRKPPRPSTSVLSKGEFFLYPQSYCSLARVRIHFTFDSGGFP